MAPLSNKRKLPTAASGSTPTPTPKRTKKNVAPKTKQTTTTGSKKNKKTKSSTTAASGPARKAVDASALAWQSLGEEEFGDLQYIEDVDVVRARDGEGGAVQFLVREDEPGKVKEGGDDGFEDDGESFEGFGDEKEEGVEKRADDDNGETDSSPGDKKKTTTNKQESKKQKATKQKEADAQLTSNKTKDRQQQQQQQQKNGSKTQAVGNSFSALGSMADGEGEDGIEDDEGDVAAWVPLNLSTRILSAIARLKFAQPTAIQEKTIPEIVAGEDVIGKAQTGSGKTLAFGIPMVERWLEENDAMVEEEAEKENDNDSDADDDGQDGKDKARKGPMALVLSPTRELAKQLGDHMKALCEGLTSAPYVCVVTGGLSIYKQQRQLEKADIVIGTPGRLWEVLEGDMALQDAFTKIRFLVVDEADRLFKAGQFKEAQDIIGVLDRRDPQAEAEEEADDEEDEEDGEEKTTRQTLVFSATFDKDLQTKLAGKKRFAASGDEEKMLYLMKSLKFRRKPKFIDVNPVSQMAEGLREGLIECGAMEKDLYLYSVLLLNPKRRTLVFTNSISAVRRLTPLLQNLGLAVQPLHSQMAQKARLRSLERFTAAPGSILVATDVAARGLDIKDVQQVLHYHVPRSADTYIHRSGRTARGDSSGISVILCSPDEVIPTRRLAGKVHAERGRREHVIQTLPLDRKIASRLKPRVDLSKKLADAVLAKEKGNSDDAWMRNAAEELGVDYDSDELAASAGVLSKGGRGGGRRRKEKEARGLSKAEMGALRAQLREELGKRVNLGVSERYITGGRVDVARLLRERETQTVGGVFLGGEGLGLEI